MQYAIAWLQVRQLGNTQNSCGELFAGYRSMSWTETGLLVCRAVASPELPASDHTHASPYSPYAESRAHGRSIRKL